MTTNTLAALAGHGDHGDIALDTQPATRDIGPVTHGSGQEHGHGHAYDTLYLLFYAVLLGTAVLQLATLPKLRALPVTVVFFVLGILCALLVEYGLLDTLGMETAHRSYDSWASIDPHLLLFTFLPPLLFGDAMTIDMHVAKRTAKQCFILAVPGVLIGAFATAAVLKFALPYDWGWDMCIMVGSILAATDPVAVVSLLKDLGASPMLTVLIQGESLLNDGTAMVLFNVAYSIVGGQATSIGEVTKFLLTSTVGAMLLGATIGYICYLWIRSASDKLCHNSSTIQMCVTLGCAYWSFIFAEGICHISGVLSTVAAALVLALKMWPVLVEPKAMTEIWHFIETFSNTLVFFLAGMLTGKELKSYCAEDFLWALVVYVAVTVIRLCMLLALRPWMNRSGTEVSYSEIGVMTWGGLRGMVGLALAILVKQDLAGGTMTEKNGEKVLFLVAGVAALTLIVNATTAPRLCELLGVSDTPEGRQVLVRKVERRAEAHVKHSMDRLVDSSCRPLRAWAKGPVQDAVERLGKTVRHRPAGRSQSSLTRWESSLTRMGSFAERGLQALREPLPEPNIEALWATFEEQKRSLYEQTGSDALAFRFEENGKLEQIRRVLEPQLVCTQQLKIVREVFLEAVRAKYWDQLQTGRFVAGSSDPFILLNSAGMAKHDCGRSLTDWKVLEQEIKVPEGDFVDQWCSGHTRTGARKWLLSMGPSSWLKWFREQELKRHFQEQLRAIHLINAFVEAHVCAQRQIASYFGDNDLVDTAEEAYVILESQALVFQAVRSLSRIAKPVQKRMHTLSEVHCISQRYRNFIHDAHASGVLHAKEAETLLHPMAEAMRALDRDRRQMSNALKNECLNSAASFKSLGSGSSEARLTKDEAAYKVQRAFRRHRDRQPMGSRFRARSSLDSVTSAGPASSMEGLDSRAGPTLLRQQGSPAKPAAKDADFLFDEEEKTFFKIHISSV